MITSPAIGCLELRSATDGDRDFLRSVYASTRTGELALTDWTEEQKAEFIDQQFFAQDFHYRKYYPTAVFQVIACDGRLAGRLYVDHWEQEIRIMDIALLPEFRASGIGTRLLRELRQVAADAGKILSIHVEKMNPALNLYQRLGFTVAEDKGVYLLLHWRS